MKAIILALLALVLVVLASESDKTFIEFVEQNKQRIQDGRKKFNACRTSCKASKEKTCMTKCLAKDLLQREVLADDATVDSGMR